ncbi:uncharacterized protein LTR77_007157 [Saxophila tyrrhenica]|uniref:Zn(2)-C6 fungal-type domain-containing protein n=1 Tax=Saxophila tyrrhenica TaxID=1690608 RepID=A0AAV9P4C7_9PEZI|nr:hypothetical protein LTR77_007157 [Saxophila tyrrhenica]
MEPEKRKRITKACDSCNRHRSKCDGQLPCSRCKDIAAECSYERVSRRHGRVSKSRRATTAGTSVSSRERSALPNDRQAAGTGHFDVVPPSENMMRSSTAHLPALPPGTPWFTNDIPYADVYGDHSINWLNETWAQNLDPGNAMYAMYPTAFQSLETAHRASDRASTVEEALGSSSAQQQTLKYPVLAPLMPFVSRHISTSMACHLLESYVEDVAEGVHSPSSPLLLAHIFRRDTLLTQDQPRSCTPALLASMLLVAAHTTEYPFFGGAPAARDRLQRNLLRLSLALMDRSSEAGQRRAADLRTDKHDISEANQSASVTSPSPSSYKRPRTAYIDDTATYMHVALVTMTTETKPPGLHFFRIAFQLAKEYRLNRDPGAPAAAARYGGNEAVPKTEMNGTQDGDRHNELDDEDDTSGAASPMSVSDDAVVEHSSDHWTVEATAEEGEERRRLWWSLYVWDRHLAIRYNSPLSIKDSESQDVHLPIPDTTWQTCSSPSSRPDLNGNLGPRGPPLTVTGNGIFDVLVPLMCILGQIIDMHHVAYHPRVERSSSNLVADAYTTAITQQLNELAPSIAALERSLPTFTATGSAQSHEAVQHNRLLSCHARFLLHLLHSLLGVSWDKLTLVERSHDWMQTQRFPETFQRSLVAADCVNDMMKIMPDLGYKAMFFGIFLYHGVTLPWAVTVVTASRRGVPDAKVVGALEVYVRAFEASNCTHQAEYLRKMRKLVLLTLKEVQSGTPLSKTEQHLRKHILKLYRWSGDGTGLGL